MAGVWSPRIEIARSDGVANGSLDNGAISGETRGDARFGLVKRFSDRCNSANLPLPGLRAERLPRPCPGKKSESHELPPPIAGPSFFGLGPGQISHGLLSGLDGTVALMLCIATLIGLCEVSPSASPLARVARIACHAETAVAITGSTATNADAVARAARCLARRASVCRLPMEGQPQPGHPPDTAQGCGQGHWGLVPAGAVFFQGLHDNPVELFLYQPGQPRRLDFSARAEIVGGVSFEAIGETRAWFWKCFLAECTRKSE